MKYTCDITALTYIIEVPQGWEGLLAIGTGVGLGNWDIDQSCPSTFNHPSSKFE